MRLKLGIPTTTPTTTKTTAIITNITKSLFVILILHNTFPCYHAQNYATKTPDPLVVTETIQNFTAPLDPRYANVTVPHKHLVFTVLLPSREMDNMNDCIMPKVLPVFELAIPHIQQMGFAHNARIDVTLISRDTNCSSSHGPLGFFEIYMQWPEVNAVFGMSCNYVLAPIARYLSVWKIPGFTTSGNANSFDDKVEYSTLTRLMGAQYYGAAKATTALLKSFQWLNVTIFYQNAVKNVKGNSVYYFCAMGVMDELKDAGIFMNVGQQQMAKDDWSKLYITERLKTVVPKSRSEYKKNGINYTYCVIKKSVLIDEPLNLRIKICV